MIRALGSGYNLHSIQSKPCVDSLECATLSTRIHTHIRKPRYESPEDSRGTTLSPPSWEEAVFMLWRRE